MILTTKMLRTKDYGTPCGSVTPMKDKCMSQDIIVDYINDYFGGQLDDVEIYGTEVCGGTTTIKNFDLNQKFFDKYVKFVADHDGFSVKEELLDIKDYTGVGRKRILSLNISDENKMEMVAWYFTRLIDCYDGSMRCDLLDNNMVDLESE